jgi:hypothetical protein
MGAHGENAATPLIAVTETALSAGPYVHAGPAFGSHWFRVWLDAGALVLLTPSTVRFAGEAVALWGAPSLFVNLGFEGAILR